MPKPLSFMSVQTVVASKEEILEAIDSATAQKPIRIATLNPEFMVEAQSNYPFRKALAQMTHCTIDGFGLFSLLQFWSQLTFKEFDFELYRGADLIADLFKRYQKGEKRFFLLGGSQELVSTAQATIQNIYPQCRIVGALDPGLIAKKNIQISESLLHHLQEAKPDILLIGFGIPKQELWMEKAASQLNIPVMIGVGGALGFYGQKNRAPQWMRILNLEWLYRGFTEPGHWRRLWRATVVYLVLASLWMGRSLAYPGKEVK